MEWQDKPSDRQQKNSLKPKVLAYDKRFFVIHLDDKKGEPNMKGQREERVSIRLSTEMKETLKRVMISEHKSQSDVIRELLHAGLAAKGYEQDEDHLYKLVKQAVASELKGPVERLASISAKAAQISGADFFMNIFSSTLRMSERERNQLLEAVSFAREQGIQFLKIKNEDNLDEFLSQGAKNIVDEEF